MEARIRPTKFLFTVVAKSAASDLQCHSQLLSQCGLEGLIVYPAHDDPLNRIDGTLWVHSGFWCGSSIHFSLSLSSSASDPSLRVTTRNLFHPLISPTDGSISQLHTVQKTQNGSTLLPLVLTLHKLFYSPLAQLVGASECVKDEAAAKLYQDDKEAYARQIKQNSEFLENLDVHSPYRVEKVESWTPELEALKSKILEECRRGEGQEIASEF